MGKARFLGLVAVLVATTVCVAATAELQNVELGGEIRIRARYWGNVWESGNRWSQRAPGGFFPGRPMGDDRFPPRGGIWSRFDWDNNGHDRDYVEQRTVLNVKADLTNDVAAFLELESYDVWGEDFRSDYITAADGVTATNDDLEFIQSYIEADNMFGQPLRLRVGRQLMKLGKGWLVSDMSSGTVSQPFDAISLRYGTDDFVVDAWWSKLAENGPVEQDGDVDFYGVYGTYKGIEPVSISAYWLWVRDARSISDTNLTWFPEWIEDIFDVDDYDTTNLHTVGARFFGEYGQFDYDLELAYQFGEADSAGHRFPNPLYGDDDAEYDNWAMDAEVGYTFDMDWQPRVFVGGLYYGGEDNRDISFWDWLNPFDRPKASVSFNRLFSGIGVADIFDSSQLFTNIWQVRAGIEAKPTDKVTASFKVSYLGVVDEFDRPVMFNVGRYMIPVAPTFSFWTTEAADDLGWITALKLRYDYSDDLYFAIGWEHFFVGDGMTEGDYVYLNGFINTMGTDDNDADYVCFDTRLKF